jgi:hypothetical protein
MHAVDEAKRRRHPGLFHGGDNLLRDVFSRFTVRQRAVGRQVVPGKGDFQRRLGVA